jgi:hypothetical protein
MKLRFVEREIVTPIYASQPAIGKVEKVKVLQIGTQGESCIEWVDIPLVIEALGETK